ncbi:phosphoadenosine phosphosulfate reductase family protein [Vibrio splendidus]|uniref:phosphoadenosine phosphosulfate reductase domain-containing protein n=1 Tax=Vibrio splendidus TaxID=29497 RepID=UPI001E53D99E|nr:phosphoadenosine phosphosulfate reductase family protein [Vibrio splendidus]MCC4787298.1 phosphoadenosine phosphosulfate reductase family protein [Vibrio splendidus]
MSNKISINEALTRTNARHVVGISGGKDSAALAIHIRNNYPEIHTKVEYFFTDTGAELEEVLDFIDSLESYLGKPIARLSSDKPFEHWLKLHNDYLPSPRQRWCTVKLKLKPFEEFVGDDEVISYVGIRADENREGYVSQKETISAVFPFIEDGLVREDIFQILEDTVGIPKYYEWRSRSGCFFCFFQRQDEWLGLKRNHPELFEKAKQIEKTSGNGYTWVQGKTLDEVVAHAEKREKEKGIIFKTSSTSEDKWQKVLANMEEDDADDQACIICSL